MGSVGRIIGKVILWTLGVLPYLAWAFRFLVDRIIALPGLKSDAETWWDEWLPTIREALFSIQTEPAAWVISIAALAIAMWLSAPDIMERLRPKPIQVLFAHKLPYVTTAKVRRGPHGEVLYERFCVGVRNNTDRTLTNLRVKVVGLGFLGMHRDHSLRTAEIFDKFVIQDGHDTVDLAPGASQLFQLAFHGIDPDLDPCFRFSASDMLYMGVYAAGKGHRFDVVAYSAEASGKATFEFRGLPNRGSTIVPIGGVTTPGH